MQKWYRRKYNPVKAWRTDDPALPPDLNLRFVTAYKLFDGTIITEAAASSRAYPLGQQPQQVDAIVMPDGRLLEAGSDAWIVQTNDRITAVYSAEFFAQAFDEVPDPTAAGG